MNFKKKITLNNSLFIKYLNKLEPSEFLGVSRILGISLREEESEQARAAEDIYADMLIKFSSLKKKTQKQLLDIIQAATREERGDKNGTTTQNTP